MARCWMSAPLVRSLHPRPACGIQPRQNGLQGTSPAAGCVSSGYACNRGRNADDARARVDVVFQPSLGSKIKL